MIVYKVYITLRKANLNLIKNVPKEITLNGFCNACRKPDDD